MRDWRAAPAAWYRVVMRFLPVHILCALAALCAAAHAQQQPGALVTAAARSAGRIPDAQLRANALCDVAEACLAQGAFDAAQQNLDEADAALDAAARPRAARQHVARMRTKARAAEPPPTAEPWLPPDGPRMTAGNPKSDAATVAACREAATLAAAGRADAARLRMSDAVAALPSLSCEGCRNATIRDMIVILCDAARLELLPLLAVGPTSPRHVAQESRLMAEIMPGIGQAARTALLHASLAATVRLTRAADRAEHLVALAGTYARMQRSSGPAESALLAAAAPLPARPDAVPTGSGPVQIVFFTTRGCTDCRRVSELLRRIRGERREQEITLREHLLEGDAYRISTAIRRGLSVPESEMFTTPAVFSARRALVGGQITHEALTALIDDARGLAAPEDAFPPQLGDAEPLRSGYASLSIAVVALAGLADGAFNPCAFTVIIFFIAYMAHVGRSRREVLAAGLTFTTAVFAAYFLFGLGLARVLALGQSQSGAVANVVLLVTALLAGTAAVLSLRDGLRCRRGEAKAMTLVLPERLRALTRRWITRRTRLGLTIGSTLVLGVVVAAIELPCTGLAYLPIIVHSLQWARHSGAYGYGPVMWLLLYNLCFIAPLVLIFIATYLGTTNERLTAYFRRHMATFRFIMAGVFGVLAIVVAASPWML
jgi:cytochrome c biogenesis protein CcdA/glutaredoxin